jgi:AcrR family transcriptional regulator
LNLENFLECFYDSAVSPSGASAKAESGKSRRTRDRLVAATLDEIAERGSFTAERVALRAGTSPATFFAHLPSKDAALTAAFARTLDALEDVAEDELRIERLLDVGLAPLSESLVAAVTAFFTQHNRVFRCALARMPECRDLRRAYRRCEDAVLAHCRRFVELGQAAGKLREGDAETLARALLVMTQGLNNPLTLRLRERDPLFGELARGIERHLAPVGA